MTVALELTSNGEYVGSTQERFAIRGRATGNRAPSEAAPFGGATIEVVDTPRSVLRRVSVKAPDNMTPFAIVSGDYNPIHTSYAAAKVAGMDAPLVHGMWLSADRSARGRGQRRWSGRRSDRRLDVLHVRHRRPERRG